MKGEPANVDWKAEKAHKKMRAAKRKAEKKAAKAAAGGRASPGLDEGEDGDAAGVEGQGTENPDGVPVVVYENLLFEE